ncbi:MAG TPA: hypothetical protein PKA77_04065 [Chitinophagaceae bacterium]|jgi:hypothetical protein|nr:hypothetical protein [Chitinophagaceae bacterium]HMU57706.1 hypothetical protein [Chitinophagaceae bacterium]
MKKLFLLLTIVSFTSACFAQDEDQEKKGKFKKENLFTGGSVALAFYNNTFLVGGSPVLGYSLTNWADAGVVINYNYTSYRDYNGVFNDKLRQYVYGGGVFAKLYPVRFLFAQAQLEHNYYKLKYIQASSSYRETAKGDAGSFLIGGGYTSGREGAGGEPFYYLSVLFDVSGNENSPYTDGYGRSIPIIRGGLQIPLFQGGGRGR